MTEHMHPIPGQWLVPPTISRKCPSKRGCSIDPTVEFNGEVHRARVYNPRGRPWLEFRHQEPSGYTHCLRFQVPDRDCWFCMCRGVCLEHNPELDPENED